MRSVRGRKGLLVVGSITQDYVETPGDRLVGELGGSATYAALAARHFVPVAVAGAMGRDRAADFIELLQFADLSRLLPVDLPTYSWHARRDTVGGEATTVERFTGAVEGYTPELGPVQDLPKAVLLGSCDPDTQLAAIQGCPPDAFIGGDTMDIFLTAQRPAVERMVSQCHVLFATQHELELLAQTRGTAAAALKVLNTRPLDALVVKLGAAGAVLWNHHESLYLPALPVAVVDPTGAGDALAGAFMGRLAEVSAETEDALVGALEWGMVAASFAISGVGVSALRDASRADLEARLDRYRAGRGSAASGA
jgi:sugar/nucleoside kinase (ribokinase family)